MYICHRENVLVFSLREKLTTRKTANGTWHKSNLRNWTEKPQSLTKISISELHNDFFLQIM